MIGAARQPTEQGQIKNLRKIFRLQTDALAIAIDQQRRAFQRTVIETQRTQQIFAVPRLDDGLVAEQKRALGLLQHRGNAINRPVRIERQYHAAKQTSHHLQQLHEIIEYEQIGRASCRERELQYV